MRSGAERAIRFGVTGHPNYDGSKPLADSLKPHILGETFL